MPIPVRGMLGSNTRRTRRAVRRELGFDGVAQLVERRGVAGGNHVGGDDLAPLRVVGAGDGDVGDVRVGPQDGLDRLRPHVLAAGDDQIAATAGDLEATVGEPPADVTGGEPAVDQRLRAVAIRPEQHRAAGVDPALVVDAHLDAVEGDAVVDDPAARLRHAVRGDHVRRQAGWGRRPTEHDGAEHPRIDPPQRGRHERHEGGPRRLRLRRVEAGVDGQARPGTQRPRHHGQPADVGQRQAGQPVIVVRHPEPGVGRPRRRRRRRRGSAPLPSARRWSHWWPPRARPRAPWRGRRGAPWCRRR